MFLAIVALLARYWRRFDTATAEQRQLIWAVTITLSLLANFYATAYDSTSLVAGALSREGCAATFVVRIGLPGDQLS